LPPFPCFAGIPLPCRDCSPSLVLPTLQPPRCADLPLPSLADLLRTCRHSPCLATLALPSFPRLSTLPLPCHPCLAGLPLPRHPSLAALSLFGRPSLVWPPFPCLAALPQSCRPCLATLPLLSFPCFAGIPLPCLHSLVWTPLHRILFLCALIIVILHKLCMTIELLVSVNAQ
jgi:hypothetical protein